VPNRVLTVVGVFLLAACQASASQPEVPESAVTAIDAPTTKPSSPEPVDGLPPEVRNLAFGYWEAFNAYDTELVLSYLETSYREEREENLREEIDRLSTFGVKLGITELSPPVIAGPDRAEMFLEMKEPLGTRRIRMGFVLVEGDWMIDFAEESGL